jgi:hypothetical protein
MSARRPARVIRVALMWLRAFQSINDQLPVLLENPKSFLEGLQRLPGPRGVMASLF